MTKRYLFAGFGGQGMLLIGKFVAMACMLEGKHVSWLPSYGPEMRGGTANCSVIVSDDPIGTPMVDKADAVVAMNLPSLLKFENSVKPGGVLVVNSSIIDRKVERDDIKVVYCDANKIAEEVGNPKGDRGHPHRAGRAQGPLPGRQQEGAGRRHGGRQQVSLSRRRKNRIQKKPNP